MTLDWSRMNNLNYLHEAQRRFFEEDLSTRPSLWQCGCEIHMEADGIHIDTLNVCPDHTYEVIRMTREELADSIRAIHAKPVYTFKSLEITDGTKNL